MRGSARGNGTAICPPYHHWCVTSQQFRSKKTKWLSCMLRMPSHQFRTKYTKANQCHGLRVPPRTRIPSTWRAFWVTFELEERLTWLPGVTCPLAERGGDGSSSDSPAPCEHHDGIEDGVEDAAQDHDDSGRPKVQDRPVRRLEDCKTQFYIRFYSA
jgi:hypothetical protein